MKSKPIFILFFCVAICFNIVGQATYRSRPNLIQVEVETFRDISTNVKSTSIENQVRESFILGLKGYDLFRVISNDYSKSNEQVATKNKQEKKEVINNSSYSIRGDFTLNNNDFSIYVRIKTPSGEFHTIDKIVRPSREILSVLNDAVSNTTAKINQLQLDNIIGTKKLAIIPLQISEKDDDYLRTYLKELVVRTSLSVHNSMIQIVPWKEVEPLFFVEKDVKKLFQQNQEYDGIISYSAKYQDSDYIVVSKLAIKGQKKSLNLFEYNFFGEEIEYASNDIELLLGHIINEDGSWNTDDLVFEADDEQEYLKRALTYRTRRNYILSNFMLQKAIQVNPLSALSHYELGINYFEMGLESDSIGDYDRAEIHYSTAETQLRQAYSIDSSSFDTKKKLGEVLEYQGATVESKYYYELAFNQNPNDLILRTRLGIAYYWNLEYDKTVKVFNPVVENAGLPILRYYLGLAYSGINNDEKALYHMQILYEKNPENIDYQYGLSTLYVKKALASYSAENYVGAIELFDHAASYYPLGGYMINYYRMALLKQGDFVKADEFLSVQINSDNLEEAYILYEHSSDLIGMWFTTQTKALELFQQAEKYALKYAEMAPGDPRAYSLLGLIYYNAGENQKGLENMEKGWALDSTDIWAGVNLLESYLTESQYDKSLKLLDYLQGFELDSETYSDQLIMMNLMGFLGKNMTNQNSGSERRYIDQFLESGKSIESWYYNLLDDWMKEIENNVSANRLNQMKSYIDKVRNVTVIK
ncbi:tetratricopeptide repeat protein [Ekhidna sp.]|uniref:tetratricopeptide repeat protein n=1 Tax=Ekhidna sp. TaxID=2608089 RepID=UPI003BAA1712